MICTTSYRQLVTGAAVSLVRQDTGPDPVLIARRGLHLSAVKAYARFHGLGLREATDAIVAAAARSADS